MEGIQAYLKAREEAGLFRRLDPALRRTGGRIERASGTWVDLASNDYLGLAGHPRLVAAAAEALARYGAGSGAARLLSGDLTLHHDLEERTAAFKGTPAALLFNSGYQANVGLVSALCGRGDGVFCDRLSHASLLDGARLSGARLQRFNHNDPDHLARLLARSAGRGGRSLVVTESVFSMEGDVAPLAEILACARRYGARLLVDEAHATGVTGPHGAGLVRALGLADEVDLVMGTYGKALGGFGAYVACSAVLRDFLINRARSFIYSTSLPAAVVAMNRAALDVVVEEPQRRLTLQRHSAWFREALQSRGLALRGCTQIVPWITGDVTRTQALSRALRERGFYAPALRPPTVPPGEARLRFSLSAEHDRETLTDLLAAIDEVRDV